ncbi:hypothetical protein BH23CHL5_BH23CHL5_00840 [soil metagenome]
MSDARSRWLANVEATWDERASWWNEMSSANAKSVDRAMELDRIISTLDINSSSHVLDAGCGSGQFAIALAVRGMNVVGVDLSPNMIEFARKNAEMAGVRMSFIQAEVSCIPIESGSVDAVFARMVLMLTPDPEATLSEFRRALKPGGRLLVSVPGARSPIFGDAWKLHLRGTPPTMNYMVPWELERLLEHLDWTIIDQWGDISAAGAEIVVERQVEAWEQLDRTIKQALATTWTIVAG